MHNASPLPPVPEGPSAPTSAAAQSGPLTPEHFDDLARAEKRASTLHRALSIAKFNAWSLGIMGVASLLMGLGDMEAMVVGGLLAILGWNEYRGRQLLLTFDLTAPTVLGRNQLALMVLLVGYAVWKLLTIKEGANPYAKEMADTPELAPMLEPILKIYADISRWLYASLILIGVVYQGGNALYYFSRRKVLQTYLQETPPWVVKLQQTTRK